MRLALTTLLLAVAGCPAKTGPGGPLPPGGGGPGVGCPSANDVFIASYLAPEEGGKGYSGWVLPLLDKTVDKLDGVPEFGILDAAGIKEAGVPTPPQNLWMLGADGKPCKLTVGPTYAAAIDAPTKNIAYGVELSGCAAPPDPERASAIVVASAQTPSECQLIGPKGVAQRLGEVDKQNQWQRPTKETPIPPALAALMPKHDCKAPQCEALWSIAQIEVNNTTVAWAGAVNWLEASDPNPCNWKGERFSGFFVAGPDNTPIQVTEGQDHKLALTAVLADKGGAKVLVAEGPGEYSTYMLGGGMAALAHHLVWLLPHPDSYEGVDHLGPACEPPAQ